jgi:hypothetical protein
VVDMGKAKYFEPEPEDIEEQECKTGLGKCLC